jgi:RNA polymerase sigma-70 factor (ECF subfamily)
VQGTPGQADNFTTTNWSVVLAAGQTDYGRAAAALERLCTRYWYPVYAFIRRRGSDPHQAEDLTQSFFTHLLAKDTLKKVDRQKGKFRSFLLAAVTNFLTNEWDRQQTQKRGGQHKFISLDDTEAEELYRHEPAGSLTPEKLFDRRWAFTVLDEVILRLKNEHAHKPELFEKLQPHLTRELAPGSLLELSVQLQMTEGAVKVALHRLRRRFGELLRSQVAYTVADPDMVEEEIRHLFSVIAL